MSNCLNAIVPMMSLLFIFTLCGKASSDDAHWGGSGINTYPVKNTEIRLVNETVKFTEKPGVVFGVRTELVFFNPTDKEIELELGFPVVRPDVKGSSSSRHPFMNVPMTPPRRPDGYSSTLLGFFETEVNGKPVVTFLSTTGTEVIPWNWRNWNAVYNFTVTFPPKKKTIIKHHYNFAAWIESQQNAIVYYVLETGGMWAGRIDSATFIYEFRKRIPKIVRYMYGDRELFGEGSSRKIGKVSDAGLTYRTAVSKGNKRALTVTFYDIKPDNDLQLVYELGGILWTEITGEGRFGNGSSHTSKITPIGKNQNQPRKRLLSTTVAWKRMEPTRKRVI